MRALTRAIVLSLLLMSPTIARAQGVSPAGISRFSQPRDTNTKQRHNDYRFAARTLTAAVGGAAGAFGLGLLGANIAPDCACDDPGLVGFLIGFTVGGA